MRVHDSLEAYPAERPAVLAVGNFDGVHRAHQALLRAVVAEARATGATAVAVSFDPHPNRILNPKQAAPLITPGEERVRQLAATGLDDLVLLPFTRDLSLLSPHDFVAQILVGRLRAAAVHEGRNFRFGHRHAGTVDLLREYGAEGGFRVVIHPDVVVRGEVVSSSRIRALVAAGAVARARPLLGRPFAVRGLIARGRGVGRQRTVPTLNLQHYEELLPGHGVYLTRARLGRHDFEALTNVGVRPTFGDSTALTVETFILNPPETGLDSEIGDRLEVVFLGRLRDERKFASPEELKHQILTDVAAAGRYFRRLRIQSECKESRR